MKLLANLFGTKCKKCGQKITGQRFRASESGWLCQVCHRNSEKNQLLWTLSQQWGNRGSRFEAIKRLRAFPEKEVADALLEVRWIERLMGNGISQACLDTVVSFGDVAVEPLIAAASDPTQGIDMQIAVILTLIGTPPCRDELERGLEGIQRELSLLTEGVHVYYNKYESMRLRVESLIAEMAISEHDQKPAITEISYSEIVGETQDPEEAVRILFEKALPRRPALTKAQIKQSESDWSWIHSKTYVHFSFGTRQEIEAQVLGHVLSLKQERVSEFSHLHKQGLALCGRNYALR